jgi:hypothetical protein
MKTVKVVFNFPGPGVLFRVPVTGANDSAHHAQDLELKLKPGENHIPEAALKHWLPRLRGVRSKRVNGTYILSADEAPPTRETLKQRRVQLERDRIALERDQLALDRWRLERERRR